MRSRSLRRPRGPRWPVSQRENGGGPSPATRGIHLNAAPLCVHKRVHRVRSARSYGGGRSAGGRPNGRRRGRDARARAGGRGDAQSWLAQSKWQCARAPPRAHQPLPPCVPARARLSSRPRPSRRCGDPVAALQVAREKLVICSVASSTRAHAGGDGKRGGSPSDRGGGEWAQPGGGGERGRPRWRPEEGRGREETKEGFRTSGADHGPAG